MNGLPGALNEPLLAALRGLGDSSAVRAIQPVGGGCINNAQRLETASAVYFLKWNAAPLPGMFSCEARGLDLINTTHTVRVPAVLAVAESQEGVPAFILLEWLEGSGSGDWARLGEQLAALHRVGISPQHPPQYGLDFDNYIGSSRQFNAWENDWVRFFAEYRLRPQMKLVERSHTLNPNRRRGLEQLIQRLPDLLGGVERRASLVHGDLWSGNVIPALEGLALIDPAVSYSDREVEIAFTDLFGGFPARFYAGYQSVWPLEPGYEERRDLYNLYHLLNHLNLFGESYGHPVDAILKRYTGI